MLSVRMSDVGGACSGRGLNIPWLLWDAGGGGHCSSMELSTESWRSKESDLSYHRRVHGQKEHTSRTLAVAAILLFNADHAGRLGDVGTVLSLDRCGGE